jgi:hypothetical protein
MDKVFTFNNLFQATCLYVIAFIPIYYGHRCIEFEKNAHYPIDKWLGRIGFVSLILINSLMIAFMAPVVK